MSGRVTSCPNCGGEVEFKAGASLLAYCGYCGSAVARIGGDVGKLEILGKIAPLAPLGSPLSIGTRGKHDGKPFEIIGRCQLDYGRGPWNEWYVAFDDGRWGWLAEAQGRVYLTFGHPAGNLPPFTHWKVGTRFDFQGHPLTVVERRRANFLGGDGELPFALAPDAHVFYCDVEGPDGVFGTLDFGESSELESVFLGKQHEYSELFGKDVLGHVEKEQAGGGLGLSWPNCGEPVKLAAPNDAQRVSCTACSSLLDCREGNELFMLQSLKRVGPEPVIPLGSMAKRDGVKWTVIGHLYRVVRYDFEVFGWEEYLLHNDQRGYRWLSCSDYHWSWVEPVSGGDVDLDGLKANYRKKAFKHFQGSAATVEGLRGEFYWKVGIGDRSAMTDWVAPPLILSRERTDEEVNWSRGTYLEPDIVAQMFKLKKALPTPTGVAPNMPNPHAKSRNSMLKAALLLTVALVIMGAMVAASSSSHLLVEVSAPIDRSVKSTDPKHVMLTEPFEVTERSNLAIDVSSDVANSWLFIAGALISQDTDEVRQFGAEVSYYAGYSGGESWSEGRKSRTVYLGSVVPGTYTLWLGRQCNTGGKSPTMWAAKARSDVFLFEHLVFYFFLLWLLPLLGIARYWSVEKRRWADSDH